MRELLKKIGDFIRRLVKDIYSIAEENSPKAVKATQAIKEWVETREGTLQDLVARTQTTKDDEALEIILKYLPQVSKKVMVADGFISEQEDEVEAANKLLIMLRDQYKEGRVKYWIILAAEFLMAIIGKRFPFNAAVLLTQQAFSKLFGKE